MSNNREKINVILVDDDADDRMLFEEVFSELKIESDLFLFQNGVEAIEYLEKPDVNLPHIIFLDLNMPVINGLEVLEILRRNERFIDVPIAIYSTSSLEKNVEDALVAGANIYITKPSSYQKLKEVLEKVLKTQWQFHTAPMGMDTFVMKY